MINNDDNFASYQAKFEQYLISQKYGILSVKSYSGDLRHFFNWVANKSQTRKVNSPVVSSFASFFSGGALNQYILAMQTSDSENTLSRRLFALKKFIQLAVENRWLSNSFLQTIGYLITQHQQSLKTEEKTTKDFANYLENRQYNKNTVRNYLTDADEYLTITSLA